MNLYVCYKESDKNREIVKESFMSRQESFCYENIIFIKTDGSRFKSSNAVELHQVFHPASESS